MNPKFKEHYDNGKKAEDNFALLLKGRGWDVRESNQNTDIYDHIDLFMTKTVSVDVKSTKRVTKNKDDTYHWVEIRNVHGKLGWLYGNADYFAFETVRYWMLVRRERLADFIAKTIAKVYVDDKTDALYKLYSRKGRKDIITLVKSLDLMAISEKVFTKPLPQPQGNHETKQKSERVQIHSSTA